MFRTERQEKENDRLYLFLSQVRRTRSGDLLLASFEKASHPVVVNADNPRRMLAKRLYRDFLAIIAHREWHRGHFPDASEFYKLAAQASIDLGEMERAFDYFNKNEAVRMHVGRNRHPSRYLINYLALLQDQINDAFAQGNISRARDLLVQKRLVSRDLGDKNLTSSCNQQIDDINAVYAGKGSRDVTIQLVFRKRLVDALAKATLRKELSFRDPFHVQARAIAALVQSSSRPALVAQTRTILHASPSI